MKSEMPRASVNFWGVRGSVPTPERENLGYGGNTACVEIRSPGAPPLIIDAGSGIRRLGRALRGEFGAQGSEVHLFFTHFHWDHVQGLPFFAPMFDARWRIAFYSSHGEDEARRILQAQTREPGFSAESAVRARCEYVRAPLDGVALNGVTVRPFPLFHPGGGTGYRVETPGGAIVYACDHEHGDPEADRVLRRYAEGAAVLIYDTQYTPQEYAGRKGWGHSTWLEATRVARDAGVKRLVMYHHDPEHADDEVSRIVSEAAREFEAVAAAKEGWSIRL